MPLNNNAALVHPVTSVFSSMPTVHMECTTCRVGMMHGCSAEKLLARAVLLKNVKMAQGIKVLC